MDKKLLKANFEQSMNIVRKSVIEPKGDIYSMEFIKRLVATLIAFSFFGMILLGLGIGMPKGFHEALPGDIFILSYSTAQLIGEIGLILKPIFLVIYGLFFALGMINLLIGINLKYRLLYGNMFMMMFTILALMSVLPLVFGLSIDGSGLLGSIIQLVLGVLLIISSIRKQTKKYKNVLYPNTGGVSYSYTKTKKNVNIYQYGGILILLSMLNRYFFHIGNNISSNPGIFGIIYGWSLIIFLGFISLVISFGFRSMLEMYYFIKYSDEYYQLFKPSNEQWYGKRKTRKKKKKE